jgi:hypothetical protein
MAAVGGMRLGVRRLDDGGLDMCSMGFQISSLVRNGV